MSTVDVAVPLMAANDAVARDHRAMFAARGIYALNLMSGPGAGKTSLLEGVLPLLAARYTCAVLEGDIAGHADADRLRGTGARVAQVNTGAECHLEAQMIHDTLVELSVRDPELVVIENVGNLVCPAEFDLGEDDCVMVLSVTEGHDKPKKYPLMFRHARLLVLNKIDLLPYTNFDLEAAVRDARDLHPGIEVLAVSCRTGEGLPELAAWIEERMAAKAATAVREEVS